jgi:hypothetical protein
MVISIKVEANGHLMQVTVALYASRFGFSPREGGQQPACQDRDNGNHNQELDQCKRDDGSSINHWTSRAE